MSSTTTAESTTIAKETNENEVKPIKDSQQRIGCKEGEFLPSAYCNKVSLVNL